MLWASTTPNSPCDHIVDNPAMTFNCPSTTPLPIPPGSCSCHGFNVVENFQTALAKEKLSNRDLCEERWYENVKNGLYKRYRTRKKHSEREVACRKEPIVPLCSLEDNAHPSHAVDLPEPTHMKELNIAKIHPAVQIY